MAIRIHQHLPIATKPMVAIVCGDAPPPPIPLPPPLPPRSVQRLPFLDNRVLCNCHFYALLQFTSAVSCARYHSTHSTRNVMVMSSLMSLIICTSNVPVAWTGTKSAAQASPPPPSPWNAFHGIPAGVAVLAHPCSYSADASIFTD